MLLGRLGPVRRRHLGQAVGAGDRRDGDGPGLDLCGGASLEGRRATGGPVPLLGRPQSGAFEGPSAGFASWMNTGGYAGSGKLVRASLVRAVACLAHVTRKFFDVHTAPGSAIAAEALERIAALHAFKKEARGQSRQRRAAPRRR